MDAETFERELLSMVDADSREAAAQIRSRLCWAGERGEITREQWMRANDVFLGRWGQGVLGTWREGDVFHGE